MVWLNQTNMANQPREQRPPKLGKESVYQNNNQEANCHSGGAGKSHSWANSS